MVFIRDLTANSDAGDSTHWGGNQITLVDHYWDDVDISASIVNGTGRARINTETTFRSGKFELRDSGNAFNYVFLTSALAANRNITIPVLAANDTLAFLGLAQTFSDKQTIAKNQQSLFTVYKLLNTAATQWTIDFDAQTSTSAQNTYANIRGEIVTNTNGSSSGKLLIYTQSAGTLRAVVQIDATGQLWCGGPNQRVALDETGLTARRTITFQDSNYKVAGIDIANTFTATNTFQGKVDLNKNFHRTGVISPTQITSDQNNYLPTNFLTSSVVRLDADSSMRSITGLGDATQTDGMVVTLRNISANTILLKDAFTNKAASSTAANRLDFGGYDCPLFPKSEVELQYDGTLSRWISKTPEEFIIPSASHGAYYIAERMGGGSTSDGTLSVSLATGGTGNGIVGESGHPGASRFTAGTSATGFAAIITLSTNSIVLGNSNYWRFDAIVRPVTLSDGTNTYTLRIGFYDTNNAESTDCVCFRYTHSVNSGKWVLVARNNSTETAVNATNTAVAASTWYHLCIIVNPAGTSAEFFENGVYLGEVTTNIPTTSGSRALSWGFMFLKSAGTTDINIIDIDTLQAISYTPTVR